MKATWTVLDCWKQCVSMPLKNKNKNLLCFYFFVFLIIWQVMTKEVDEIVSKMEENMSSPMRTFQSFVDQISIK
jgi:hypothetical protein